MLELCRKWMEWLIISIVFSIVLSIRIITGRRIAFNQSVMCPSKWKTWCWSLLVSNMTHTEQRVREENVVLIPIDTEARSSIESITSLIWYAAKNKMHVDIRFIYNDEFISIHFDRTIEFYFQRWISNITLDNVNIVLNDRR